MCSDSFNEKVFRFLEGAWQVERSFRGSYEGSYAGKACFERLPNESATYLYNEQGGLIHGQGQQFDAKQNYRYRLAMDKLEVYKQEDGAWELMHELDFEEAGDCLTAAHVHLCGEDHYATTYKIDLNADWEVTYAVNGPEKNYHIQSRYFR